MPTWFQNIDTEVLGQMAWEERRGRVQGVTQSVTPEHAAAMTEFATYFPTSSPGLIRSLAQGGYDPDHPVARFAITQDMLRKAQETGNAYGQIGRPASTNRPRQPTPMPPNPWTEIASHFTGRTPESNASPESSTFNLSPEQRLMKEAQTLGVFDPETGLLISPEDPHDAAPDERAMRVFKEMVNLVHGQTAQPVPFLRGDALFSADPSSPTANLGEYSITGWVEVPIDPTTGERIPEETSAGREQLQSSEYLAASASVLQTLLDSANSTAINRPRIEGNFSRLAEASTTTYKNELTEQLEDFPRFAPGSPTADIPLEELRAAGVEGYGLDSHIITPALVAFDAPLQEFQGLIRNTYGQLTGESPNWAQSQSDLGIIIPRLIRGQHVDVGGGLGVSPESAVARERRAREASAGMIGDHRITLGRILANTVSDPDTKPFQLISGLTDGALQVADPTSYVLGKYDDIVRNMNVFQAVPPAGTFSSFRNVFHGPTADAWLTANPKLVSTLADTTSAYDIARLTNFKLDPSLTHSLSQVRSGNSVRRLIRDAIDSQKITRTTDLRPHWPTRLQTSFRSSYQALNPQHSRYSLRFFSQMPTETWDLEDPAQVARNMVRTMVNAKAPEEEIAQIYNRIASATNKNALRQAVLDTQIGVGNQLRRYGINDDEVISYLTRTNQETYQEHARGLIDEVGSDVPTWEHMTVGGATTKVTGPHLPLEHIGRYMHTPNVREVRRLTTKYPFLTAAKSRDTIPGVARARAALGREPVTPTGDLRLPLALLDSFTSQILKPMWLLRLAWPIRVIGEEQLRMSAAGLTSAFSGHPVSYLSMVIGSTDSTLQRLIDKVTPGIKGSFTHDPSGALMSEVDALAQVTYRAHSSWLDSPGAIRTHVSTIFNRTNPHEAADFRRAWGDQLALLSHDPISRQVLREPDIEAVTDWLYQGAGQNFRRDLMDAHPGNLVTRAQTREYLDTIVGRVQTVTQGDPDLINAITTGKFTDPAGKTQNVFASSVEPQVSSAFRKYLTPKVDTSAPDKIRGTVMTRSKLANTAGNRWNTAVDQMMYVLMGAPTSTLSRSPAFRQFLWKRTADLLPWADVPTRAQILANARTANLPKRTIRNLERAADVKVSGGRLNLDEVNDLAKAHAIDDTKNLLYDLSQKSQASDILRNIAPFGEAWREVITRWADLAFIRGPGGIPIPGKPIRRAQQIIEGLRGEELGDFFGNEDGQGFFFKNEFGEEVFAYPGSEWITNAASGIPVPLHGRTQGLNMFGSILPSVGPVVQIPAAIILQDKPSQEFWREQLLPFGGPGAEDAQDVFGLKPYLPAWAKTGYEVFINTVQNHTEDRIYGNNLMQVATYLSSTGEYGNTPEEQQRLMNDARVSARKLYTIRALGQFLLPSSPSFQWLVQDDKGNNLSTRVLADEFYTLSQDAGYQEAVSRYLDMYGEDAIGAIIPHSRSVIYGAPTSLEAAQWVEKNASVKKDFPLTYGFFAPTGEFHNPTYVKSFTSGERETLTVEEWNMLRDSLLGNYHFQRALDMLGDRADNPADNQRAWLEQQRKNIEEAYPKWGHHEGLSERPTTEHMVEELYRALDDPTLARTDVGRALDTYLRYRDQAQAQAEELGYVSFNKAQAMAPTRQWLAEKATRLIEDTPDFRQVWNLVLSRELVLTELITNAAASDRPNR